jgi:glycosyltransferase involved in cell wall biosynthesis
MSDLNLLSAIVPTLNESNHIEKLLLDYLKFAPELSEIFIVDGGSTDGTIEIVNRISEKDKRVKILFNEKRFVSFAFNLAFGQTNGKYIALLGGHSDYSSDYFKVAIKSLESNEADAVGGVLIHCAHSMLGKAIANAMSSVFGVGDTPFRTKNNRMYVDSVAFAIYKREIFEKVGLLDEELIRNQDDEFHYRLNQSGFRILMLPEIKVNYYVRENLAKLFDQFYQYGYYKPLVIRKVKTGLRLRHLIPTFFLLYLLSLPILFVSIFWIMPLLIYLLLSIIVTLKDSCTWQIRIRMPLVFPVLHIAYGCGFLIGLIKINRS